MLTQKYPIDMVPGGVPLTLHVTQYDAGMTEFVFVPFASSGAIDLSVVTTARIEATKPDRLAVVNNCTYANGEATYLLQKQLTAKEGAVWSKLVLLDANSNVIASKAIVWEVDRPGVTDDATVSESDVPLLREAIEASAESVSSSEDSEAWSVGKRNGIDVGPDDPAYHNNAKYYAEHASAAGVTSVNGKTGIVTIDAEDVGALPDTTPHVSSFNGATGAVTYAAPVDSVNGQTGAVALDASDVGALPDTTPHVSSFNGATGAVTYAAPVDSVNGQTGAVALDASDVGALPDTTPHVSSFNGETGDVSYTPPVNSVNGKTGAVTVLEDGDLTVTLLNVSSSSRIYSCSGITENHKLRVEGFAYLSNPAAVTSELTLVTSANTIEVRGTLSGTTNIIATFTEHRTDVTATAAS